MPARPQARALKTLAGTALFLALGLAGLALPGSSGAQASRPTVTTAAATATEPATAEPTTETTSGPAALAAAMARNRQAAVGEAQRLLRLAKLPPSALRTKSVPEALAGGPVLGTPGLSSLVVQTQYWRAPMPFHQVQAWLEAHPPQGLTFAGSSTGGGPGPGDMTVGYGYTAPSTPQLQSPELEIGAASASPSGSAIRVDAVVVWTDPRPWPDNAEGRRIHVNVAAGCPPSVAGVVGVSNPGALLTSTLIPVGAPTAALVCRYNGSNGPSGALPARKWQELAHQARLDAAGAGELARVVAAAPVSRTGVPQARMTFNPPTACPMDDGEVALLAFSYSGRPDVDLWVQLSGCSVVGNGYILGAGTGIAARVKMYG